MKILVACEESQRVCEAFREKGHEAIHARGLRRRADEGKGEDMGTLINKASLSKRREPTQREVMLPEIRQAYRLGNWKHGRDLKKHYDKLIKERKI